MWWFGLLFRVTLCITYDIYYIVSLSLSFYFFGAVSCADVGEYKVC